jgi:hypothetical protein
MAKLTIVAAPTFRAEVPIPVPGAQPVPIAFEFKHRDREALDQWRQWVKEDGRTEPEIVGSCVSNWFDMDQPFSAENLATFLKNYHGASAAITERYVVELIQARLGN